MSSKPTGATAPKVFISYRREETAAHAGRLYDAVAAHIGAKNVFMDVDIDPGVDFVERITEVVSSCRVLILVMGRNWATATDDEGVVRLTDPDDFVRLEAETAVRRSDVTPIPVLVSGAQMPKREQLPEGLHQITRRNALDLSDARWAYDVGRLIKTLDRLLADSTATRTSPASQVPPAPPPAQQAHQAPVAPAAQEAPPPDRSSRRLILEGMLVAGATAFAARYLANAIPELSSDIKGHLAGDVILRRTETWALTGAALALWLGGRARRTDFLSLGMLGLLFGALAGAIGGAVWALPVLVPNRHLDVSNPGLAELISVASLAVTGGFLGSLIGRLWRPRRSGAGLVGGALAGAAIQVFINTVGWNDTESDFVTALSFGVAAVAIAAVALAVLYSLDQKRAQTAFPPVYAAVDP